jgi:TolB-like protein/Tfp pilus assembly protein PilF
MRLVSELRRRNVFRMAVLYVIAAWLIMQVAGVLIDLGSLPDWIGPIIVPLLAVGFPLALVFSWFYELTPEGISLEKDVEAAESITHVTGRRMDFIVISLLCAAVILFAYDKWRIGPPPEKSIAVLAFENMSDDPEQEYFSDGISEEVLNTLAKVEGLRVISRSSSFSFKGKDLHLPTIAKELNVAHVLEGSVRRMGTSVRITAQLVNAESDSHLWSETFDRELTTQNIFAIQSDIAVAIADKLRATLSRQEQVKLGNVPTSSLEAYQFYWLGKQRMFSRASASLEEALEYFAKAITTDPEFALAYVGLAETYMLLGDYAGMSLNEVLENAEPVISKALALDDELVEAYVARGAIRAKVGDFGAAIPAFQRAIELDPNHSRAHHWYGDVLLNYLRQPDTALPMLERAYTLDPVSPALIVTIGQALSGLGQFEEAMVYFQKAREIEPAYASTYYLIGSLHAYAYGRLDLGVRWSLESYARDPGYVHSLHGLGIYYLALGDNEKAEFWIDQALSNGPNSFPANMAAAYLHLHRGNEAEVLEAADRLQAIAPGNNTTLYLLVASERYREALRIAAEFLPELACDRDPDISRRDFFQAINVSLALEKTGATDCANRLLDKALEQMQVMPRVGYFGYGFADVEVYARQKKKEQALTALRQGIDDGCCVFWWTQGERNPHTESLGGDPEFNAMMDEIRSDMAVQLENLRDMEARGELPKIPL